MCALPRLPPIGDGTPAEGDTSRRRTRQVGPSEGGEPSRRGTRQEGDRFREGSVRHFVCLQWRRPPGQGGCCGETHFLLRESRGQMGVNPGDGIVAPFPENVFSLSTPTCTPAVPLQSFPRNHDESLANSSRSGRGNRRDSSHTDPLRGALGVGGQISVQIDIHPHESSRPPTLGSAQLSYRTVATTSLIRLGMGR